MATILALATSGQDEKNEVGGRLRRTFISDQGKQGAAFFDPVIHSGTGLTLGGEYALRFWVAPVDSISGEGSSIYNSDVDLNAGGSGHSVAPSDLKKLFLTPAVRLNL